jgi:hypothetical protein
MYLNLMCKKLCLLQVTIVLELAKNSRSAMQIGSLRITPPLPCDCIAWELEKEKITG